MTPDDLSLIHLPRSSKVIALTACHRIPERSIKWKGNPLICYRCLGLDLGVTWGLVFIILSWFVPDLNPLTLITRLVPNTLFHVLGIALLLQIPFILDGSLQALTKYESINPLRFFTGLIGGVGQVYILLCIANLFWTGILLLLGFLF